MDGVPFELLDPCCQKDVLERRRNKELRERFSTTDPSLKKERQIESVFTGVFKSHTCHTCCAPRDYHLLAQARLELEGGPSHATENGPAEHNGAGESDSDSDFDDDFESEFELELKKKLLDRVRILQEKEKVGLGLHVQDSESHLQSYIENGTKVIIHIYDPDSPHCAKLDLSLEMAAKRFSSTRFRRIPMSEAAETFCSVNALPSYIPVLACFSDKRVVLFTNNIEELVPNGEINSSNCIRFLENSKVATDSEEVTMSMSEMLAARAASQKNDSDVEEDANDYCDEPGCDKKYAHNHISAGNNIFSGDASGSDALGKDYFGRL